MSSESHQQEPPTLNGQDLQNPSEDIIEDADIKEKSISTTRQDEEFTKSVTSPVNETEEARDSEEENHERPSNLIQEDQDVNPTLCDLLGDNSGNGNGTIDQPTFEEEPAPSLEELLKEPQEAVKIDAPQGSIQQESAEEDESLAKSEPHEQRNPAQSDMMLSVDESRSMLDDRYSIATTGQRTVDFDVASNAPSTVDDDLPAVFQTGHTLNDNPFEMTNEQDASWIVSEKGLNSDGTFNSELDSPVPVHEPIPDDDESPSIFDLSQSVKKKKNVPERLSRVEAVDNTKDDGQGLDEALQVKDTEEEHQQQSRESIFGNDSVASAVSFLDNLDSEKEDAQETLKVSKNHSKHNRIPSVFVKPEEEDFFSTIASSNTEQGKSNDKLAQIFDDDEGNDNDVDHDNLEDVFGNGKDEMASKEEDLSGLFNEADKKDVELGSIFESSSIGNTHVKQQSTAPVTQDLSSSLAFLEGDEDLLDEDEAEDVPAAPVQNRFQQPQQPQRTSQNRFAHSQTQQDAEGLPARTMPHVQTQHNLKSTKSFINQPKTGDTGFDLPAGIVPRSTVRRVTSFQQNPTYAPPFQSQPPVGGPPAAPGLPGRPLNEKKSFFEELPMPVKRPAPQPRASMDPIQMQAHQVAYRAAGSPQPMAPPPPPKNPYVPMSPPIPQAQPARGHSRNSSLGGLSTHSLSPQASHVGIASPPMAPLLHGQAAPLSGQGIHSSPPTGAPYQPQSQQSRSTYAAPQNPYAPPPGMKVNEPNRYAPTQQPPVASPPSVIANIYAPRSPQSAYQPAGQFPRSSPKQPGAQHGGPYALPQPKRELQPAGPITRHPPPPTKRRSTTTYGDLPEDLNASLRSSPRNDYAALPPSSAMSPPIAPGYKFASGAMPESLNLAQQHQLEQEKLKYKAQQQRAAAAPRAVTPSPVLSKADNEALMRRQFPIFRWGTCKRAVVMIPPGIAFATSKDIKIVNVGDLLQPDNLINKFPSPLLNAKGGANKSKKKELEKWMDERIASMEAPGSQDVTGKDRFEHKVMLWKIVRVFLRNCETVSCSRAVVDNLEEIRSIIAPGAAKYVGNNADDLQNFASATDIFRNQFRNRRGSNVVHDQYSGARFGPEELRMILTDIEAGNRGGALRKALENRLWAHALLIASSMGPEQWRNAVSEFVREEVRNMDPPASQSLAFMYKIFAGSGADSVSELTGTTQRETGEHLNALINWRNHLAMIISNPSPNSRDVLMAMKKSLADLGLVEASHICALLSGSPNVFGNPDKEQGISILGATESVGLQHTDNVMLSEIFEFIQLAAPQETSPVTTHYPHLLLFKIIRASELADYGFIAEAQRICENVVSLLKLQKNGDKNASLLQVIENVSYRVAHSEEGTNQGYKWFKPNVNKMFAKILGDEDEFDSSSSQQPEKEQVFKRLQDETPTISRIGSFADLQAGTNYAPAQRGTHPHPAGVNSGELIGALSDTNVIRNQSSEVYPPATSMLPRIQSHNPVAYPPPAGPARSLSPGNSITGSPPRNPYAPPATSSGPQSRSSSIGGFEPVAPSIYETMNSGVSQISRPSSVNKQVPGPSRTPENMYAGAAVSMQSSPQEKPLSPPQKSTAKMQGRESAINPYAPTSEVPVMNPYAPLSTKSTEPSKGGNKYAPVGISESRPIAINEPRESSDIYGYLYHSSPQPKAEQGITSPIQDEDRDKSNEEAEKAEEEDEESYPVYEPPSYGIQPTDDDIAQVDLEGGDNSNMFVPLQAPQFGVSVPPTQRSYQSPLTDTAEAGEEVEDFGIGNSRKEPEPEEEESEKEEEPKKTEVKGQQSEEINGKKGWFSWLRKGEEDQPKAVRAKLGEKSRFYYDEKLKRWVNKDAPVEDQQSDLPPPPPKKPSAPLHTHSAPPMAPATAPSMTTPMPSKSPMPKPTVSGSSTPGVPLSGGLDDLLGAAPPPGDKSKRARRGARNRYVDIMQQ
ncbi:hypothetical protein TRVA0_003S00320 [Trichomonascus vanleenenianus]|uniref:COPII coat assembly protein SEC16 n=1 Tax=Trichomonascus vanleenenianus TaxID=2268995 RepID=UPI003ECA7478